jgi:hypothetical protein
MSTSSSRLQRRHPKGMNVGEQDTGQITPGMLLAMFDQPIMFRRAFVHLTGSVTSALLLTYACSSSEDVDIAPDMWITRSMEQWMENTGMSRTELESARRRLRELELLEERRAGLPATTQYRVNASRLNDLLRGHADRKYGVPNEDLLSSLMRSES